MFINLCFNGALFPMYKARNKEEHISSVNDMYGNKTWTVSWKENLHGFMMKIRENFGKFIQFCRAKDCCCCCLLYPGFGGLRSRLGLNGGCGGSRGRIGHTGQAGCSRQLLSREWRIVSEVAT